jgi:RHS repeat-associated protein
LSFFGVKAPAARSFDLAPLHHNGTSSGDYDGVSVALGDLSGSPAACLVAMFNREARSDDYFRETTAVALTSRGFVVTGNGGQLISNDDRGRRYSPPNAGPVTAYAYDQRNLLTSATLDGQPLTGYVYDGQGNRLQQVDHSGAQPITTTYTNDIIGLVQVLVADDGTAQVVNLFGLDLIHQDDGSQTLTLLADGLGSVRSEMAGSAVRSTTTYEPYGNLLVQEGASGTPYGFTGEQEDDSTGLLYLRARYYSSYLNRFLTTDPLEGEPRRPRSFNAYMYVYANPATWADPSGRDPYWCEGKPEPERTRCYNSFAGQINPRDLTSWLFDELSTNVNDPRLRAVRGLNTAGDIGLLLGAGVFTSGCLTADPLLIVAGVPLGAGGAGAHLLAFYEFGELVGDHKPWDFKHAVRDFLGPGITLCSNTRCKRDIEFSTPGNIHFGYVAREAGYAGVYVHAGAGYAEWDDPSHDPDHPDPTPYEGDFDIVVGPSGISLLLGDDPSDHPAVQFGIYLYDKYGRGLNRSQFVSELERFLDVFAERMPEGDVRQDVASDWPYWVGYFVPPPLP